MCSVQLIPSRALTAIDSEVLHGPTMTKREGELPDTILTLPHKEGIVWDQLQPLLSSLPRYPSMEPAVREERGQLQWLRIGPRLDNMALVLQTTVVENRAQASSLYQGFNTNPSTFQIAKISTRQI